MTQNIRRAYSAFNQLDLDTMASDGVEAAIIDQLTNLMHLAKQMEYDWDELINTATIHFQHEEKHDG